MFVANCQTKDHSVQTPSNIFDQIPALVAPRRLPPSNELVRYLQTDPEFVEDVVAWWYEKHDIYPFLSQMALDYLTLPGKFS